jgi:hypothetical protein
MTEKTKPNFLKVVDVKPVILDITQLGLPALRQLASMEMDALVKRLNKRKTVVLHPYETAVVTFIKSFNAPTATDDAKLIAGEVFRQALIDLDLVITRTRRDIRGGSTPRKYQYHTSRLHHPPFRSHDTFSICYTLTGLL